MIFLFSKKKENKIKTAPRKIKNPTKLQPKLIKERKNIPAINPPNKNVIIFLEIYLCILDILNIDSFHSL